MTGTRETAEETHSVSTNKVPVAALTAGLRPVHHLKSGNAAETTTSKKRNIRTRWQALRPGTVLASGKTQHFPYHKSFHVQYKSLRAPASSAAYSSLCNVNSYFLTILFKHTCLCASQNGLTRPLRSPASCWIAQRASASACSLDL